MCDSCRTFRELNVSLSTEQPALYILLSDEATLFLQYFLFTFLCLSLDVFGVVSNIINVICFIKQGFKDPVNISLLALAVSDIGCLLTLVWTSMCYTPSFASADLPFDTAEFQYLISGIPHTVFTRITGWITALITIERCLCITAPLQVKTLVTTTRVSYITVVIFVILILSATPEYLVHKLDWKFFPEKNKTLLGLSFTQNRENVVKFTYVINNALIPNISFLLVIISTTILVIKLTESTRWRKSTIVVSQEDKVSSRNRKVSKMIVIISSIFVSCFIPVSLLFLAMAIEPEFFIGGKYRNFFVVLGALGINFESINSSVNIFIYYSMSKNYRLVFIKLFTKCKVKF